MNSKHTFFSGQPVFSQLLYLIPRSVVANVARKHQANRYCKTFMAYDHLVAMLYQGFFQCLSIRELITGLLANAERLRHLGLTHTPRRSTLSDANARRNTEFFKEVYHQVYKLHFPLLSDSSITDRRLFIIDSTTVSLFSNIMAGAGVAKSNGRKKGGAKAHVVMDAAHNLPCFVRITEGKEQDLVFLKEAQILPGSIVVFDKAYINYSKFNEWNEQNIIWVTRQKNDASFVIEQNKDLSQPSVACGVLSEQLIKLGRPSNHVKTPLVKARRIGFTDPQTHKEFTFITNDTSLPPEDIAAIYKSRWKIELLFKRIKQRYPLRYFLGDNENAIHIQIWSMLLCDLLVQVVMKRINARRKRAWSYANLSAMIKHHLMTYISLFSFLINPEKALLNYKEPATQRGTLF